MMLTPEQHSMLLEPFLKEELTKGNFYDNYLKLCKDHDIPSDDIFSLDEFMKAHADFLSIAPSARERIELKQEQAEEGEEVVAAIPLHETEEGDIQIEVCWEGEMIYMAPVWCAQGDFRDV